MDHKNSTSLVVQIELDMRRAMKDCDTTKVNALKGLLARFSNAEAVKITDVNSVGATEVPRKILSPADRKRIIDVEIDEMQQVINRLEGHSDYKVELERKIIILREYLPAQD